MPSLLELQWKIDTEKYDWKGMKIGRAVAVHPFSTNYMNAVGVDPGTRWGLGVLLNGTLLTMWGTFPQEEHDYEYFYVARQFINEWIPTCVKAGAIRVAMIEGASYGSVYKQPLLEDVRLGFKIGLEDIGYEVTYVPPKTVAKRIFGSGNLMAKKVWLSLRGDAADAAAIALYAGGFTCEEETSER